MVGLSSKSLYTSQRIFLLINDSKIIHPEFKKDNAIDLSSNGMFANIFETVEFLDWEKCVCDRLYRIQWVYDQEVKKEGEKCKCLKWVDLSQKEVCDRYRYVFVNDDVWTGKWERQDYDLLVVFSTNE